MWSNRKAAAAFFPYAVWKEQHGDPKMVDAFIGLAVASGTEKGGSVTLERFMWKAIGPFITTLFDEASPNSLNRVIVLVSPHVHWETWGFNKTAVTRWAAAALAVPYTELVGQCVVDALLQLASIDSLRPYIPIGIWAWLDKQPPLPCVYSSLHKGTKETKGDVVRGVRALRDVDILKSYLLLVWLKSDFLRKSGFTEMCASIREDFSGIGMGCHREDLIKQLDHVLERLGQESGSHQKHMLLSGLYKPVEDTRYRKLKEALLEVDREALEILTRKSSRLTDHFDLLTPIDVHRIPLNICLCTPSPMSIAIL